MFWTSIKNMRILCRISSIISRINSKHYGLSVWELGIASHGKHEEYLIEPQRLVQIVTFRQHALVYIMLCTFISALKWVIKVALVCSSFFLVWGGQPFTKSRFGLMVCLCRSFPSKNQVILNCAFLFSRTLSVTQVLIGGPLLSATPFN